MERFTISTLIAKVGQMSAVSANNALLSSLSDSIYSSLDIPAFAGEAAFLPAPCGPVSRSEGLLLWTKSSTPDRRLNYRGNDGDTGGRALITELIRGSRPQPNGLVGLVT